MAKALTIGAMFLPVLIRPLASLIMGLAVERQ
jgi:hypothetical protein